MCTFSLRTKDICAGRYYGTVIGKPICFVVQGRMILRAQSMSGQPGQHFFFSITLINNKPSLVILIEAGVSSALGLALL